MKELVMPRASAAILEVLVIEDDVEMQEMVGTILRPLGYRIRSVTDGMEGLALMRSGSDRYCLVLLDLGLAGMNGFELLAHQSHDPAIDRIPVIVMSGRHGLDEMPHPKAWVHTLHKPMAMQELTDAVVRFARPPGRLTIGDGTVVAIEDLDTERYVSTGHRRAPLAAE
jgi:CheY-like chemotaxis protein